MAADRKLIEAMRRGLKAVANPSRAPGAEAYMKSTMPFLGTMAGPMRAVANDVAKEYPLSSRRAWRDTCLTLWREATYREERYAAIELTGHRQYLDHQRPDAMPMYEEFIVDGVWWDYVDAVAIHRVGPLLREFTDEIEPIMRTWSTDGDMWRRRTSIICQVGAKADIDLGLLYDCIEPNMAETEFFIRKAIGWALRSHAWLNPAEVQRYVAANQDRLSGLSRREALKNMGKLLP